MAITDAETRSELSVPERFRAGWRGRPDPGETVNVDPPGSATEVGPFGPMFSVLFWTSDAMDDASGPKTFAGGLTARLDGLAFSALIRLRISWALKAA